MSSPNKCNFFWGGGVTEALTGSKSVRPSLSARLPIIFANICTAPDWCYLTNNLYPTRDFERPIWTLVHVLASKAPTPGNTGVKSMPHIIVQNLSGPTVLVRPGAASQTRGEHTTRTLLRHERPRPAISIPHQTSLQ